MLRAPPVGGAHAVVCCDPRALLQVTLVMPEAVK